LLALLGAGRVVLGQALDLPGREALEHVAYLLQWEVLLLEPPDQIEAAHVLLGILGGATMPGRG
jgi:hypothetical protein